MEDKRVADYYVLAGVPAKGKREHLDDSSGSSSPCQPPPPLDPITDITVIIRSEGETIPPSWYCIETTPSGFPADLNHGSFRSPSIFLCFRRGRDKPPLVDIGVLYEGKERVMADSEVVQTTLLGRPANVNNSGSRTFLTYRRAKENAPCNQLVVTDICVLLMNKGETPPHAFCLIRKNLNKGMVGSDVYICYKKSMNRPPLIRYQPSFLSRFPLKDYTNYSLPDSVPLFCMPMGGTIESWLKKSLHPRPVFSTFVLTSDSAIKVYGAAITFYETISSEEDVTDEEKLVLSFDPECNLLVAMKSLCILSRWPFFDTFERFLVFLYRSMLSSSTSPLNVPLERYISHFMLEVPFPSLQRPKILLQLTCTSDETIEISQPPEDLPLPLSGASFTQMLRNLGPENCMNVLVLALAEQKILLHSLRPDVLTGVAEAVTSIIFPFVWQCPYIPLCPLTFCEILHAPLPFITGVDSRYFDISLPPNDVVCVDLDTNSIYLSEAKRFLNSKALPKKAARVLRSTLETLFERLIRPQANGVYGTPSQSQSSPKFNEGIRRNEQLINLEIQAAFVKFMSSILKGFRSFLRPITRAPTVGWSDPGSLFDLEEFLTSRDRNHIKFYELLMRTQMFAHFIEQRSFVSDKETCLAFFDECLDKIESNPDFESSTETRLIDVDDYFSSPRTVFIPAPEPESPEAEFIYSKFPSFDSSKFQDHPHLHPTSELSSYSSKDNVSEYKTIRPLSPICRRTKQEVRIAQRIARRHAESPLSWAKCLVSYVYSLWFVELPSFAKKVDCGPSRPAILRMALNVLNRMQSLNLHPMDETCYRILLLLCGEYSHPVLAVKVLFEMKKYGVVPNAITYGYYNKAVLESQWPSGDSTAVLLWSKLRNVVIGVNAFKQHGQRRRKCKRSLSFSENDVFPTENGLTKQGNENNVTTDKVSDTCTEESDVKASGEEDMAAIVRTPPAFSGFEDLYTSAGVLITGAKKESSVHSSSHIVNKKKITRHSTESDAHADNEHSSHPKLSMRSYSFGSDAKIIQSLKEGPLKALKHELERNHQIVPEEDLKKSGTDEDVSGSVNSETKTTKTKPDLPQEETPSHPDKKSLTLPDSARKVHSVFKSNRSSSVDGWIRGQTSRFTGRPSVTGSMSPLKDALENLSLFSPDSKVASSIKSGWRYAAKLVESPTKKSSMSRSNTFDSTESREAMAQKPSLFHVKTGQEQNKADATPEKSCVPDQDGDTPTSMQTPSASPWTKGFSGKGYWNSTIKSAANSMASRISEIKSNLSTNSPARLTGTLSQWATLVAEKLPATPNFSVDDDDAESIDFENRRLSVTGYSEDDLGSERSREGSIARYNRSVSTSAAIFETMEKYFKERLEEKSKVIVLQVEMSSCCRCYNCFCLVFDEEIMEGWSADDSNLNTDCVHCESKFVPFLTITVTDVTSVSENEASESQEDKAFTVPYLSPLVLRKEMENVLEHEGDLCLLKTSFIDDHPIIFWNLVWYFERMNLPSHLPGLALGLISSLKVGQLLFHNRIITDSFFTGQNRLRLQKCSNYLHVG